MKWYKHLLPITLLLTACTVKLPTEPIKFTFPIYTWSNQYVIQDTRISGQFCPWPSKKCNIVYDQIEYEITSGKFTEAGLVKMAIQTASTLTEFNPDKNLCTSLFKDIPCSPNFLIQTSVNETNDPLLPELWGLTAIRAKKAWNHSTGTNAIVAITDTGIDKNHPDLQNQIINCYNAITDQEGDCKDENGHGTHVAGTIAATANNLTGVVGVSYNAKLMALKFLDASGSGSLYNAIKAIDYATLHGADVINASWGGGGYSQPLYDSIKRATDSGILFIAAAGNSGLNTDIYNHYPSKYDNPLIISVAATDIKNKLASFSNYGKNSVDVAAPGVSILSTFPNNSYKLLSGTSMAAPHVTGLAALYISARPEAPAANVRDAIYRFSRKVKKLRNKVKTEALINARRTLTRRKT